mgnify:CR=1 FL=1
MAGKKPWPIGLRVNSKAHKLPKKLWEKGKSKFADIRLHDEGKSNISEI